MLRCVLGSLLLLLMTGCQSQPRSSSAAPDSSEAPVELTVFAAASLTDAFRAVADAFEEARPGTTVTLNLGGSQQLAQQLRLGAPGDVFASANPMQMDAAVASGRIAAEAPQPFVHNRMTAIVPAANPADLQSWRDLARSGVQIILAAEAVPAGRYARRFLDRAAADSVEGASFRQRVLDNAVSFEQNVRAVLTKIALGEADAGLVYASDAAQADSASIRRLPLPDALNPRATYLIAPVDDSAHPDAARAFVRFVRSDAGQSILARYGLQPLNRPS